MTVIEAIVEAQAVIRKLLKIPYYNTTTSMLEYPKGTSISGVSTTASTITAFNSSGLSDGMTIFFSGRDTANDGGGGWFTFSLGSVATADGGSVFAPTGGGRLLRDGYTVFGFKGLFNVKYFGAKGDGVTDDTAAIQSAIDALQLLGGGNLYVPPGIYLISSELTVDVAAITIKGLSRFKCLIKQSNLSSPIITTGTNAMFFGLSGLSFIYSGTPLVGATALKMQASYATLTDFVIRSSYIGVSFIGAAAAAGKVNDFEILDYESSGLVVQNTNDTMVSNFIMNAGNTTRGALGGIRLLDKVEAFVCRDGDILLGQHSMTSDAAIFGQGTRPAYNKFTNVYFDSFVNTVSLDDMVETDFVSCWWSGGRSGGGAAGMNTSNSDSVRFTNCLFFNNGAAGATISASSLKTTFVNCKSESNSVTAGVGVAHGFNIANNAAGFKLISCTASNGLYTGQQGYGVYIGAGCDNFVITDGDYRGNATGSISDGSAATEFKISGNLGYKTQNKGTGTIIVGQTVATITHGLAATPSAEDISLTFTESAQARGVANVFVASIGATTFQIVSNATVTTDDLTVSWSARIKGS